MLRKYSIAGLKEGGVFGPASSAILRTLQAIFSITTAVLYGLDLTSATDKGVRAGSMWVYAEVASGLSMLACLGRLFFTTTKCRWSLVDWVIFILWVAQFGVFGNIYLGLASSDEGGSYVNRGRMLAAVWIDMVNMLLWLASGSLSLMQCCVRRRRQKQQREATNMKVEDMERGGEGDAPVSEVSLPSFPPAFEEAVPRSPPPQYSSCSSTRGQDSPCSETNESASLPTWYKTVKGNDADLKP